MKYWAQPIFGVHISKTTRLSKLLFGDFNLWTFEVIKFRHPFMFYYNWLLFDHHVNIFCPLLPMCPLAMWITLLCYTHMPGCNKCYLYRARTPSWVFPSGLAVTRTCRIHDCCIDNYLFDWAITTTPAVTSSGEDDTESDIGATTSPCWN